MFQVSFLRRDEGSDSTKMKFHPLIRFASVTFLLPMGRSFVQTRCTTKRCQETAIEFVQTPQLVATSEQESNAFDSQSKEDHLRNAFLKNPEYQRVVENNMKMHEDAVNKSEETFYGFYSPDGFTEFDFENSPSEWTCYAVDQQYLVKKNAKVESIEIAAKSENEFPAIVDNDRKERNIWDALLQLDKNIIPPPFSTPRDLARVSKTPILSASECHDIISECESHYYGWGGSKERYGTPCDRVGYMIKLEDLSKTYSIVNFDLLPRLYPAILNAFPDALASSTKPENFRLGGCRIVKYDASDGHVELGLHRDGLLITANVALNDLSEYEGGGTYVEGVSHDFMASPIRLPKGHVMLHPGDVLHGGAPITSGIRYVLVCFILDKSIIPHEKYCQDRMQLDIEAARLIPPTDEERAEERSRLLASATKHCADAYAFGKLSLSGEHHDYDGYEDIVRSFERFYNKKHENVG